MSTHSLVVQGVGVHVGAVRILERISCTLHPGELCAVIGPSGAGKSTLIRVLLGLRVAQSGSVRVAGRAPGSGDPIGYVPQEDALHRALTVDQALDFAARIRLPDLDARARNALVMRVCRDVGLDERLDVRIRKLSGGQRKRVSLALELLTEPPLLVLDEPTSGLDPGLEARMMDLLAGLARRGRMVMVTTHAMQSLTLCQLVLVLVDGQLACFAPPADTLTFFGADRFEGIFERLRAHPAEAWAKRYRLSPLHDQVAGRAPQVASPTRHAAQSSAPSAPPDNDPAITDQLSALKRKWGGDA